MESKSSDVGDLLDELEGRKKKSKKSSDLDLDLDAVWQSE